MKYSRIYAIKLSQAPPDQIPNGNAKKKEENQFKLNSFAALQTQLHRAAYEFAFTVGAPTGANFPWDTIRWYLLSSFIAYAKIIMHTLRKVLSSEIMHDSGTGLSQFTARSSIPYVYPTTQHCAARVWCSIHNVESTLRIWIDLVERVLSLRSPRSSMCSCFSFAKTEEEEKSEKKKSSEEVEGETVGKNVLPQAAVGNESVHVFVSIFPSIHPSVVHTLLHIPFASYLSEKYALRCHLHKTQPQNKKKMYPR